MFQLKEDPYFQDDQFKKSFIFALISLTLFFFDLSLSLTMFFFGLSLSLTLTLIYLVSFLLLSFIGIICVCILIYGFNCKHNLLFLLQRFIYHLLIVCWIGDNRKKSRWLLLMHVPFLLYLFDDCILYKLEIIKVFKIK